MLVISYDHSGAQEAWGPGGPRGPGGPGKPGGSWPWPPKIFQNRKEAEKRNVLFLAPSRFLDLSPHLIIIIHISSSPCNPRKTKLKKKTYGVYSKTIDTCSEIKILDTEHFYHPSPTQGLVCLGLL